MTKRLRVPDEPRFVRALALRSTASLAVVIDPGDTLGRLMEIGALGRPDPSASLPSASLGTRLWRSEAGRTGISVVRRTRKALIPAYDRASELKDWD